MFNPLRYVHEVRQELGRVTWPSRQQTARMTALVVVVSVLVAAYIAGIDLVFQRVIGTILNTTL